MSNKEKGSQKPGPLGWQREMIHTVKDRHTVKGETLREAVWSQIPEGARLQGSEMIQIMGPWQTHQVIEQRTQPWGV